MEVGQSARAGRRVGDRAPDIEPAEVAVEHPRPAGRDADGVSLARLLERGPLRVPHAIVVGLGVLAGLCELQRRGLGHGSLDTSSVLVDRSGQARLVGEGSADASPNLDVIAAGRVLCAALGIDPRLRPRASRRPKAPSFIQGLSTAARTIADGGAGASATGALVMFGDAACRIGEGLRIQRTPSAIASLAIPPPTAIMAAVDRVMVPAPMPVPAVARPSVATAAAVAKQAPTQVAVPASVVATLSAVTSPTVEAPSPVAPDPVPAVAHAPEPARAPTVETPPTQPHVEPFAAVVAAVARAVDAPGTVQAPAAGPIAPQAPVAATPRPTVHRKAVERQLNSPPRRHPIRVLAMPLALFGACVLGLLLLLPRPQHAHRTPAFPVSAIGVPSPAATVAAPPDAVVTQFYQLVAAHSFDQALALWDDNARNSLGPTQYPAQRFADTTQMSVNSAKIISSSASTAVVAVDLTEQTYGVLHNWVGTWRLVFINGAWLLDTAAFQGA